MAEWLTEAQRRYLSMAPDFAPGSFPTSAPVTSMWRKLARMGLLVQEPAYTHSNGRFYKTSAGRSALNQPEPGGRDGGG